MDSHPIFFKATLILFFVLRVGLPSGFILEYYRPVCYTLDSSMLIGREYDEVYDGQNL